MGGCGEGPVAAGMHSASLEVSMLHMVAAEAPPTKAISTTTQTAAAACTKALLLLLLLPMVGSVLVVQDY